ncbi:unnamed protein product, partial [marine sediment metagenome]
LRITREWKLDETGDIGSIIITLDTVLLPAKTSDFTEYVVWVDSDGNFSSGATQYSLEFNNNEYITESVDFSAGNYISFGILRPVVRFSPSSSNDSEGTSPASIKVSLNHISTKTVTVDYSATGGTATNDSTDYDLDNGSLTFLAGDTVEYITPVIINDTIKESEETIIISLSNPSSNAIIGADTTHTFTINDDDNSRTIQFSVTTDNADEDKGQDTIVVEINLIDNDHHTTSDYTITGTATGSGEDYTLAAGTISVYAGYTSNIITFNINDDNLDEDNET